MVFLTFFIISGTCSMVIASLVTFIGGFSFLFGVGVFYIMLILTWSALSCVHNEPSKIRTCITSP